MRKYTEMKNSVVFERLQNLIGYLPQQKEISEKTGINQNTLSAKKTRDSHWKDEEIEKLNAAYNIDIYKNISQNNIVYILYNEIKVNNLRQGRYICF